MNTSAKSFYIRLLSIILWAYGISAHAAAPKRPSNRDGQTALVSAQADPAAHVYTLDEAMNRVFTQSFNSQIEYQNVIQARLRAQAHYLDLLPHVSASSALSALAPSLLGYLGSVGDFVPFLLPSRWFLAKQSVADANVELMTQKLMNADLGATLEQLIYALKRDQKIYEMYQDVSLRLIPIYKRVKQLDDQDHSPTPPKSAEQIEAVMDVVAADLMITEEVVRTDKEAIAYTLGLTDPESVLDVTVPNDTNPISQAPLLDTTVLHPEAEQVSLELKQEDLLMISAQYQKKAISWGWLDPSGSGTVSIFDLHQNVDIARSEIDQLKILKSQQSALVWQKLASAVNTWNSSVKLYPVVASTIQLDLERIQVAISQLDPYTGINPLDLEGMFQDYIATSILKISTEADFRSADTRISRSLLKGYYAQFAK